MDEPMRQCGYFTNMGESRSLAYITDMYERRRACSVESHFLAERENRWLQVLLSSDEDRISHVSRIFEEVDEEAICPVRLGTGFWSGLVESAVSCTLHRPKCLYEVRETGWYRGFSSSLWDGVFILHSERIPYP